MTAFRAHLDDLSRSLAVYVNAIKVYHVVTLTASSLGHGHAFLGRLRQPLQSLSGWRQHVQSKHTCKACKCPEASSLPGDGRGHGDQTPALGREAGT